MTIYPLPEVARAAGYAVGILLLDFREPHALGDTANALTYDYPVIFRTVTGASVDRITCGDPTATAAVVAAAQELERMGVAAISSNCGFMLYYQDAVRNAVKIPVFLSSMLQLPMMLASIRSDRKAGLIVAFTERLSADVLALAGVHDPTRIVATSIQDSPEFRNLGLQPLDTAAFTARLVAAAQALLNEHPDLGAVLIECATFTPYAAPVQRALELPVYDFISLIDHARQVTHRRDYAGT
jgi:Asp/Glu/hydantoin racemase